MAGHPLPAIIFLDLFSQHFRFTQTALANIGFLAHAGRELFKLTAGARNSMIWFYLLVRSRDLVLREWTMMILGRGGAVVSDDFWGWEKPARIPV
jgi:hypothetical protein